MPKWEYQILAPTVEEEFTEGHPTLEEMRKMLNREGGDRWELVAVQDFLPYFKRQFGKGRGQVPVFYFRREKIK